MILLQRVPLEIELGNIRRRIENLDHVVSLHDLHVWQLIEGVSIASGHIAIETGADFSNVVAQAKQIFHDCNIHSSTLQPEFVDISPASSSPNSPHCKQNCVTECDEDWCCKKAIERTNLLRAEYSPQSEI